MPSKIANSNWTQLRKTIASLPSARQWRGITDDSEKATLFNNYFATGPPKVHRGPPAKISFNLTYDG